MKSFQRQWNGYLKWISRTKARPFLMFSDRNKHFSSTIVCIHYMSDHWKLSVDFLKHLSNEKLNLKEWWYQRAFSLLSLNLKQNPWIDFCGSSYWPFLGAWGNSLCGHWEDSIQVGNVDGCQLIHPSSRPCKQEQTERPAAAPQMCHSPELGGWFLWTISYFSLLSNCSTADNWSRNDPTVITACTS